MRTIGTILVHTVPLPTFQRYASHFPTQFDVFTASVYCSSPNKEKKTGNIITAVADTSPDLPSSKMAARLPARVFTALGQPAIRQIRPTQKLSVQCLRFAQPYSSEASQPPLFTKLKCDLKNAMKAKDTARLSVLRGVISAVNNASKTSSPVKTDVQLLGLLRKTARSSQDAVAEFQNAGRSDLVDKEEAQIRVLQEYMQASEVESVSDEDLRAVVAATIAEVQAEGGKVATGEVMKRLNSKLKGKDFDAKQAAEIVKNETKQ